MRVRKKALFGFALAIVLSAYLGFANISLPHDKALHFSMFFIMSFLFYWILDSNSLRMIRTFAFVICTLVGGIGSEFVQPVISPTRTFDAMDIVANVAGSVLAIIGSNFYHSYTIKHLKNRRRSRTTHVLDIESRLSAHYDISDHEDDDHEEIDIPLEGIHSQPPKFEPPTGSKLPELGNTTAEIK